MTTTAADGVVRINCWSTPRTLSTAMMYSFDSRGDCTAVDEPLYAHHLTQCPHLAVKRPYITELMASQEPDGAWCGVVLWWGWVGFCCRVRLLRLTCDLAYLDETWTDLTHPSIDRSINLDCETQGTRSCRI